MKMRRKTIVLIAGVVVLAGAVVWFFPRPSPLAPRLSSEKATYYCPMHPTYTSDRPGDCPICNMKLVKREVEQPEGRRQKAEGRASAEAKTAKDICYLHNCPKVHEGKPCPMLVVAKEGEKVTCPVCGTHVVDGSKAKPKKILYWTDPMIPGYKSDKPGKSPMGMDLVPVYEEEMMAESTAGAPEGYAPILVSPKKQQLIGVKTSAVVRRRLTKTIRAVGTVAHDPQLYQAQAEYLQALQALERIKQAASPDIVEQTSRLVEATQIRLRHLGLSDELIQELSMRSEPEHGLLVGHPGEPAWIYAKVYEPDVPLIRAGQSAAVEVPSLANRVVEGAVRAIDPMVDAMTRTTRVRVQVDNPLGELKPEMYVNVSIQIDLGEVLAVPQEAVMDTGLQRLVFVDQGQGLFEPRDIQLGAKADEAYEVAGGLDEGERVVTSGNFLIDSESRLKAAISGMAPPPAASAEGGSAPSGAGPMGERAGGGVAAEEGHQHAP